MSPSYRNNHPHLQLINRALLKKWRLPKLDADGGKESRGCTLVVGGTQGMPGAAILAGLGALRAGTGKLQIAAVESVAPWIALAVLEARVFSLPEMREGVVSIRASSTLKKHIESANAVVIGPGMSGGSSLQKCIRKIAPSFRKNSTLILDAEALKCAEDPGFLKSFQCAGILTPHAGEMASIMGCSKETVKRNGLKLALELSKQSGWIVVLKGHETLITTPEGKAYRNKNGNIGLGSSGSGDTLAGIIAGLCARGASADQAAAWGVALHGLAGDLLAKKVGSVGYLAREIVDEIPLLIDKLGSAND